MIKDSDSIFLKIDASVVSHLKIVQAGKPQAKHEITKEKLPRTIERIFNPSSAILRSPGRMGSRQEAKGKGLMKKVPLDFYKLEPEKQSLNKNLQKIKEISTNAYRINDSKGERALEMLKKLQQELIFLFREELTNNILKVLVKNLITSLNRKFVMLEEYLSLKKEILAEASEFKRQKPSPILELAEVFPSVSSNQILNLEEEKISPSSQNEIIELEEEGKIKNLMEGSDSDIEQDIASEFETSESDVQQTMTQYSFPTMALRISLPNNNSLGLPFSHKHRDIIRDQKQIFDEEGF